MPDQAKNMLIGIFVTAACAIVIFVLMFLHPSVGDEGRLIRVRFANIDKISVGTRVTFAGKPVGEVVGITELPDAETERKATNGYVYIYELLLRVDSSITIFNTDEVTSRTSGLLGEKSVAILPGAAQPGEELRPVDNEVIYATESGSVEDTLKEFKELSNKVETALDGIIDALTTLKDNHFWENLSETAVNFNDISTSLNNKEQLTQTVTNIHSFSENANTVAQNANTLTQNANAIVLQVKNGEGSLGQLLYKDELYLRLNSVMSKAEITMNDINHYGILFHLDKGWQRLRARRLNLLQNLSTPQQFRNYFNDEIDMVATSLERVSMIMEQLNCQPAWSCCDILQNSEFTKVYADLLRRISSLEEEVRLYNQQVVDTAVHQTELIDYFECCE
jgi:phospholipid/cholesterol/gamma-HCH transport system substrate-binding protein